MEGVIVFYDGDCGFCRWSCERLRRWDTRGRLRLAPIRSPLGDQILGQLDPRARASSFHVFGGEEVISAGRAIPVVLRELPGGRPLARFSSALPNVTETAYRFVARHRRGVARLVGERACAVDPSRGAAPAIDPSRSK